MSIMEIQNRGDALKRLAGFYGSLDYGDQYADLLTLLSDPDRFKKGLRKVSRLIWIAYNSPEVKDAPNRFTRAIIRVAGERFGFSCQENVVLTAQANAKAFGKRISDGVLWKDSFALGHGEFAHSYQWLVAGLMLNWGTNTAAYYKAAAAQISNIPLFVKDAGGIVFRKAPLWEWLVDCTKYNERFDKEAEGAATKWMESQIDRWANEHLTSSWFVDAFFRDLNPTIKSGLKPAEYETFWKKKRGKDVKNLLKEIRKKSDMKKFAKGLCNLYRQQNALTETSYRNANNVTALAREPGEEWFISIYENHRHAKLLAAQGQKFRRLTAELLRDLHTKKMGDEEIMRDQRLLDPWARLFDISIRVEMLEQTGPDREKPFHVRVGNVALKIAKEYDLPSRTVKDVKPISALIRERKDNYEAKKDKGWQTATDEETIFLKKIVEETVRKNQIPKEYHKEKGWVNENALTGLVV